jgi:3-methyladenine DNA glycosylase/8-oxoguanine DNA glycosylase
LTRVTDIPLLGSGGEPVDFARTIASHGVAELPPNRLDLEARVLETTLPIPRGARTIQLTERRGQLRIDALAGSIGERARDALTTTVAHMFRFDENLFDFYTLVKEDGELSWCAGRGCSAWRTACMLSAPTVFEDVVKTK